MAGTQCGRGELATACDSFGVFAHCWKTATVTLPPFFLPQALNRGEALSTASMFTAGAQLHTPKGMMQVWLVSHGGGGMCAGRGGGRMPGGMPGAGDDLFLRFVPVHRAGRIPGGCLGPEMIFILIQSTYTVYVPVYCFATSMRRRPSIQAVLATSMAPLHCTSLASP